MIAAMFVCSRRFGLDPAWRRLALPTLLWAFSTVGAFFLIPALGDAYFGVGQRIFIATWLTWLITVAAYARRGFEPNPSLHPEDLARAWETAMRLPEGRAGGRLRAIELDFWARGTLRAPSCTIRTLDSSSRGQF